MDEPGSVGPELRGQHAVEGRGSAAALQVAEHERPHLAVEPPGQFAGHDLADAPQPHLPPLGSLAARPAAVVHEAAVG